MDDKIDIEEHDLLDNPTIRQIFPDLSIIKSEISGYFDEASGIKKEPAARSTSTDTNSHTGNIDVAQLSEKACTPLLGNKIIMGSKPSKPNKIAINDSGQQDLYAAKVYLNDIGSYLDKTERFCKICLIMFPQKENLEIHKTTAHIENMDKIAIGSIITYKCHECHEQFSQHSLLRTHLINIHRKKYKRSNTGLMPSSPLRLRMVRSTKLNQCFHCKVSFSSKKLLNEHICMVLQSKKKHGGRDRRNMDSNFRTKSNNDSTTFRNIRRKLTDHKRPKGFVQKTFEKLQDKTSIFQCFYCSYILSRMSYCLKHIINKHKDSSVTEVKAVKFNQQCKYCYKKNCNWKLHNKHMQMYHKEKIDKTIKVYPKICLPKVDYIMPKALVDGTLNHAANKQTEVVFKKLVDGEHNEKIICYSDNNDQLILKSKLFKSERCVVNIYIGKFK